MEITTRSLWTLIHGMGFGALYLLAGSGAIALLYQRYSTDASQIASSNNDRVLAIYLSLMAALAWLAVLTGTYIIYPWYRATPPNGTVNLGAYPRSLLLSHPATGQWHSIGMEWKEHVAWIVPIAITAAAVIVIWYARDLKNHPQLRSALLGFVATSLFAAGIAGFFGAMLNKNAPVDGGQTIHLVQGE
ncbi:MAG: hypothetical protein ABR991_13350 [Terracidiphilus sp.]|jgi:hypothetical protein